MKNIKENPLPEDIARLVREEESAAMARFRGRDFTGRLKRTIAAAGGAAPVRASLRKIPRWMAASAGVLAAAAIIAYVTVPKRGADDGAAERARPGLVRLPGLDGLDLWAKVAALGPARLPIASDHFAAFLSGMKAVATTVTNVDLIPTEGKAPHLGLEKLMEILVRDRAVEKALSLVSPKFKEG
jgi:hypothetical protein